MQCVRCGDGLTPKQIQNWNIPKKRRIREIRASFGETILGPYCSPECQRIAYSRHRAEQSKIDSARTGAA